MVRRFRPLLFVGAALLAAPAAARAADVNAEGATAAETQLRSWLAGLLGPSVRIGESPIHLTPAGDHYDVSIPLALQNQVSGAPMQVVGSARPLDDTKWAFDGLHLVTPVRFTLTMPVKDTDDPKAKPTLEPVTFDIKLDSQDMSGILDPSFKSPTTWSSSTKGLTAHADNPHLKQDSTLGATNTVTTIKPAGDDRVDVTATGTLQDYKISSHGSATGDVDVAIGLARVNAAMTGLSRERGATIVRGIAGILTAAMAQQGATGTPTAPKVAPELLRTTLAALQDLASEVTIDETFQNMTVTAANTPLQVGRASLGLGGRSESGLLRAYLDLGMEDLAVPGVPLGDLEALVPKRVALRPFVGNVAVADLLKLANDSSDNKTPPPADINALFSHGGIATGLESMRLELAGASFTGTAKMTVPDPNHVNGTGQIVAEGFDALMAKIGSIPMLQQGLAVAAFVKGIGHESSGKITWDISFNDNKLLVNGVDLTAMAGGGGRAAPSPGGAPKAPAPPPRAQGHTR